MLYYLPKDALNSAFHCSDCDTVQWRICNFVHSFEGIHSRNSLTLRLLLVNLIPIRIKYGIRLRCPTHSLSPRLFLIWRITVFIQREVRRKRKRRWRCCYLHCGQEKTNNVRNLSWPLRRRQQRCWIRAQWEHRSRTCPIKGEEELRKHASRGHWNTLTAAAAVAQDYRVDLSLRSRGRRTWRMIVTNMCVIYGQHW